MYLNVLITHIINWVLSVLMSYFHYYLYFFTYTHNNSPFIFVLWQPAHGNSTNSLATMKWATNFPF